MKTRRTTLRALMIAVALAALASWGWVLRQRSAIFASEAQKHYHRLELCLANRNSIFDGYLVRPTREQLTDADKVRLEFFESWVYWEARLVGKYRRASTFPWASPAADPPTPFHSWLY
jgi:hypothetical protein